MRECIDYHWQKLTNGMTPAEVERVHAATRRIEGHAQQTIFQRGDLSTHVYLVGSGVLEVLDPDSPRTAPLKYLRPGDHFGFANLFLSAPRELTVRAITDVMLFAIAKSDFDVLVQTIPALAFNLCIGLAEWIHRALQGDHQHRQELRVVALLRTASLTSGVAPQLVARLAQDEPALVLTDRPTTWDKVKCDLRPLEGDGQLETLLAPIAAASAEGRRVILDLGAECMRPDWLVHCDEAWLLEQLGPHTMTPRADQQLLHRAPELATRLRAIWLPSGERLPVLPPHGLDLADRQLRIRVLSRDPGARVSPGCLERLVHRLEGLNLGLALGGGGRGAAHIGVIRALERAGLYFDRVAGTSIGSVVAAGYAAGFDADEVARFFLSDFRPPRLFRYLPRGNWWYLFMHYYFGLFEKKLRRRLSDCTFEQLLLPLHTVTTDLFSGMEVVREAGDVTSAVLESIHLPGIVRPILRDGQMLVDGGVLNNVPADVLPARRANFVVSVKLSTELGPHVGKHMWQLLFRIMDVQSRRLDVAHHRTSDVVVMPMLGKFRFEDFSHSAELIEAGEAAGEKMIPEIRRKLAELRGHYHLC